MAAASNHRLININIGGHRVCTVIEEGGIMTNFMTPLEVQLGLGLALLIGLSIGWVTRGWGERYERRREDQKIEKAGVWRSDDRGYFLSPMKQGSHLGGPRPLLDQVAGEKTKSAA